MPDAEKRQVPREGRIVTFYSFKGGTGRTMALANVAWILAANGKRVLIADWDLESPGLHRFFQPFLDPKIGDRPGILDFIRRYEWAAADAEIDPDALISGSEESMRTAREAVTRLVDEHIGRVEDYAIPLNWQFPDDGVLQFLSSGRQKNGDYQMTLSALDWDNFYDNLHGGQFFDALRALMKENYDYVLIDSRTGLSDVADICMVHLPDVVVDCFTLATQGIEGAAMIAGMIQAHTHTDRNIKILPVPMRIDHAQKDEVEAALAHAAGKFEGLPAEMSDEQRREYWEKVEVPYRPAYAYDETLATVRDWPGSQTGLLPSYEQITALITEGAVSALPPGRDWLRLRTRVLYSRTRPANPSEFVLDFRPEDQLWAEWIAAVLATAEIPIRLVGETSAFPDDIDVKTQTVAIVSDSYIAHVQDSLPAVHPSLFISVTDTRVPPQFTEVPAIYLAGLSKRQAVDRLTDRLKGRHLADSDPVIQALRYPGGEGAQILNMPARNVNFTGREQVLKELREELQLRGGTVVPPLTIYGLGGVGKTQLALEYAHRFKEAYDIIWWMNCGQAQYVDSSLFDLGDQLRKVFDASVPEEGGVPEVVQQVLRVLTKELEGRRWLLVYDNAEQIDEIKPLLPSGGGHVLITSRDERWTDEARKSLQIDIFKRAESIGHLRLRVSHINDTEALQVAEVLRDMPLAVASAGAVLASTEISVSEYLQRLEQQPVLTLSGDSPLRDYSPAVAKAWSLSLDHLQNKSAAASRLLEICSVMAPDISLDLINSQAMADNLQDLDPAISERAMIARLIWQIDQLALIKFDNNARQIQVHRVVQAVVNLRMSDHAKATARQVVHQLLVEVRPQGEVDDPQTWSRYRLIWPHLRPSEAMWSSEPHVRQLLIERVRYMRQREDVQRGRRRAEEIEAAWTTMLASQREPEMVELRRQLFRLQFDLANILRDLAEFEKSRRLDSEVLKGQQRYLGRDHLHTLQTQGSLAADLRALGEYSAALELSLETYKAWRDAYGEEYRGTLSAAHNLALSYLLTGDFRNALAQDRLTLERRTSVHGPLHPRTFNSGASVARDLLEAGRYAEAASRMDAVWVQCRDTLGENDRNTLNARLLLGVAQRCAGHPELAETHIDSARTGLTRGFGEDSTDALGCRLSQTLNWLALKRYSEAMTAAQMVLTVYEGRVGPEHPHSLICQLNFATALCLEEDYPEAETKARLAVEGLESRLGAAHPYALAAKMVLASVLARQGHLREAGSLEELVTNKREEVLGSRHPDTLRCHMNLLLTRQDQKVEGAADKRQAVIGDLSELIGANHPDVISAEGGNRLLCVIDPLPF
jgi:MinD-like ATPase involved in chromosome partitioning or flagellar assembly